VISKFIRIARRSSRLPPSGAHTESSGDRDFEAKRAKTLEYVRTTQEPLREHGGGTPPTSAYQLVLMLSGHTERHTAQLPEVKASPGYPKN
jgi:hypothetical protein